MRKPKNSNEGKDRLKALAAAAARAAGANLTTYFADDDGRGSRESGKRPVRHFDFRHLVECHLASPSTAAGPERLDGLHRWSLARGSVLTIRV